MKHYLKRAFMGFAMLTAVMGLSTILAACNGSADAATTGVTMAQVNAAIADAVAPLKKQIADQADEIAALKGAGGTHLYLAISHPKPKAQASTASLIHTLSADTPPKDCTWTLSGHPATSSPISSDILAGTSCGYSFNISAAPSGGTAYVQALGHATTGSNTGGTFLFTGASCTGDMYVAHGVSSLGAYTGAVFLVSMNESDATAAADPGNYYMVAPGTPLKTVTKVSSYTDLSGCVAGDKNALTQGYLVVPNDPSVTGVPNAPVPGPVLPSTLQ